MDVQRPRSSLRVFRLGLFLTATWLLGVSAWAVGPKIPFNIPAGSLSEALRTYREQSGVVPLYSVDLNRTPEVRTKSIVTNAVAGRYDVAEAIKLLLDGTGLTFEFSRTHNVWIVPVMKPPAAPKPRQSTPANFSESTAPPANLNGGDSSERLPEVTVTGSLLRGLRDIMSPLIRVTREEMKASAYGTVQDVLRALPQTFGGGPSEDFSTTANFMRGSSVDLRGLGPGATLLLINGRRQPVSSIDGNFVDVSTIPWSAVDRIEVLTDGASALYGSDAIAGVVNVVMRDDLQGIGETQLRMGNSVGGANETLLSQSFGNHGESGKWLFTYQYSKRTALASAERAYAANDDKRPFGGSDLRSFYSSPGNILDPLTQRPVFGIGPNGELSSTINLYNRRETADLLPDSTTHSAFFTGSQKLGEHLELFAEGRFGRRHVSATERAQELPLMVPASNPFFIDPFGDSPFVLVAYNMLDDLGPIEDHGTSEVRTGTLGLKVDLPHQWRATLSGSLGQERMHWLGYNQADFGILTEKLASQDRETAFNPFGDGTSSATFEAIRLIQDERARSQIKSINFTADGSLPPLFGGTPKIALGVDLRLESLNREMGLAPYERQIKAGFMELSIPLAARLDISLAGRYEEYSDFGDSLNPKVGIRWTANDSLRLRGSWGTSFRVPTLVNTYDRSQDTAAILVLPDPTAEKGFSIVIGETGRNPDLHEEHAKTWTAGIDFAPSFMPGLTLSGTYYVIGYDDRIFRLPVTVALPDVLVDKQWSALVTRNPPRSEVERICNAPLFFGSRTDCLASSQAVVLDLRLRNLSATTVKGIDVKLEQTLQTNYGSLSFGLNGSNTLSFEQALTRTAAVTELVGIVLNPSALRLRGTTDWYRHGKNREGFGMSLAIDHLTSSRDHDHPPVTRIAPWTTLDLQLSYQTARSDFWLGNVEFVLNAANVFDEDPPFVNREEGYDPTNAEPTGRVVSFTIRKSW